MFFERRILLVCMSGVAIANAEAADLSPRPGTIEAPVANWAMTLATEFRYFSWKGDRGYPTNSNTFPGRGDQIYIPYALQLVGRPAPDWKLDFLGRGGWVDAHQRTPGLVGEVQTVTDTVASGTATYYGFNGVQPFVSLATNLPTGKSSLPGNTANARMDPDLVEMAGFGEGYNIGPTFGVNIPITPSFIVTTSVGYNWRLSYDRDRSLSATPNETPVATDVDPGDVLTVTLGLGFTQGALTTKLIGTVSAETETVENGTPLYKAGLRYVLSWNVVYNWSDVIGQTALNASWAHSDRNQVQFDGASALMKEWFNTNSNLYKIGIQHLVPVGRMAIGPTGSFLYRDENGYDATTLQFVPAKERWTVGALARYAATDKLTLNARVDAVFTREQERLAPGGQVYSVLLGDYVSAVPAPVVSSTGWQVAVGANLKF